MDGLNLHEVFDGTLYDLNRSGFETRITPLMGKLEVHHDPPWQPEVHHDPPWQVMLQTNRSDLERFRTAFAWNPEVMPGAPGTRRSCHVPWGDWRERAEFLDAVAQQGGLELFDAQHVFRTSNQHVFHTSEAMLKVEALKTLRACL